MNKLFTESVVTCKRFLEAGETMRLDCALGAGSTGQFGDMQREKMKLSTNKTKC